MLSREMVRVQKIYYLVEKTKVPLKRGRKTIEV